MPTHRTARKFRVILGFVSLGCACLAPHCHAAKRETAARDRQFAYVLHCEVVPSPEHDATPFEERFRRNTVVVEVNGVPAAVRACAEGIHWLALNRWIGDGTNRICVSGPHKDALSFEVRIYEFSERVGSAGRMVLSASDEMKVLETTARLPWRKPEAERLDPSGTAAAGTLREARFILGKLEEAQREQDVGEIQKIVTRYVLAGAYRELTASYRDRLLLVPNKLLPSDMIFTLAAIEFAPDNLLGTRLIGAARKADEVVKSLVTFPLDVFDMAWLTAFPGQRLPDGNQELKYIYGPRGILFYRGIVGDDDPTRVCRENAFLYYYKRGDGNSRFGDDKADAKPLVFIRRDKKWEIW